MPELPEVETTVRAIRPLMLGKCIRAVVIRSASLRWPLPRKLVRILPGQRIQGIERRAKYLLLQLETGTLIMHLGMSGSIRVVRSTTVPGPHDHFELLAKGGLSLRLRDPRRFGCVLWTQSPVADHPLLAGLGPEPLGPQFDGWYLFRVARRRRAPIKNLLMDGRIVAGIGNIYASEALHLSGIHPRRAAGRISLPRYERLADSVRQVLARAIEAGGTTFRDFVSADGAAGRFRFALHAYGRGNEPCRQCGHVIRKIIMGQRATYYCPGCQR
ncbi:MAG: DNA-formamidopyrimidine glycosylase [Planctomycetes bacterium RBG_16_64_10]|nr:MAG: DNA-formamidopyrimidine glycosylase [Planctomycetes bacterium RBG_16_64_10]